MGSFYKLGKRKKEKLLIFILFTFKVTSIKKKNSKSKENKKDLETFKLFKAIKV